MKFIQAAGQQAREARRLEGLGQGYMRQLLRVQVTEFFTQAVPGTLTSLSRACAFLIGGYWVIQGTWQLGALIAFSTYLGMAVGPVQSLLGLYVALQRMTVSLGRVMELQQEPVPVRPPVTPVPLPDGPGTLRLEGVHFAHEQRAGAVLEGVDAEIPAGLKVAISGASGVGKSTLIDLLQRFYDPDQGRILLDGVDLRELDLLALRRRIAVVSQDIVLFRGTLAENLAYSAPTPAARPWNGWCAWPGWTAWWPPCRWGWTPPGRAWPAAFRRAETAHRHRPRAAAGPADPGAGRSHLGSGRSHRARGDCRHRPVVRRAHAHPHQPPAVHPRRGGPAPASGAGAPASAGSRDRPRWPLTCASA